MPFKSPKAQRTVLGVACSKSEHNIFRCFYLKNIKELEGRQVASDDTAVYIGREWLR